MKIPRKIKKILASLFLVCVAVFCAYDIISSKNAIMKLIGNTQTIQNTIDKLQSETIKPTEENLQKLQNEYFAKQRKLENLYTPTKKIKIIYLQGNKPKNEVDFYFTMMSYVDILTQKSEENNIILPKDFKFGFDPYVQKDVIPPLESIELLYKQSKIVAKLLTILFESNEHGMKFISFQRESIAQMLTILKQKNESQVVTAVKNAAKTVAKTVSKNSKNDIKIDTTGVLTATDQFLRRDNKESYLFSLEFECYTPSLRKFFNLLHDYRLPVVVRKLEIITPQGASSNITSSEMSKISLVLEWFLLDKIDKEHFKENSENVTTNIVTNTK
jgi:hypothetical protein